MLIPYVVEKSNGTERSYDLWSRLLKDRIIFLGSDINDETANIVIAQMLFLEKEDPKTDIQFYINSPGGCVYAGLAIYDVMQMVQCDVSTMCVGKAASMGAILLAAGTPGKRAMLSNSRVMIHQVSSGFHGTTSDINIHAKETNYMMDRLIGILAQCTQQDEEKLRIDCDRDFWMSAEEAVEYKLVDEVFKR